MTIACMIDIETLATSPDAVILSAGAIKFDPYKTGGLYAGEHWRLNVDQQTEMGRCVDPKTIEWWSRQNDDVQAEAFSDNDRVDLAGWMKDLNKYMVGVQQIWCQGPQFDMVIIEDLYRKAGVRPNWPFWKIRDARTLFDMMPSDPRKQFDQSSLHNALEDSRVQAQAVQYSYRHFNIHKD